MLTASSIQAAGENLKDLKFDNQLEKEHLGIGTDTWVAISVLKQEHDTKFFFSCEEVLC